MEDIRNKIFQIDTELYIYSLTDKNKIIDRMIFSVSKKQGIILDSLSANKNLLKSHFNKKIDVIASLKNQHVINVPTRKGVNIHTIDKDQVKISLQSKKVAHLKYSKRKKDILGKKRKIRQAKPSLLGGFLKDNENLLSNPLIKDNQLFVSLYRFQERKNQENYYCSACEKSYLFIECIESGYKCPICYGILKYEI